MVYLCLLCLATASPSIPINSRSILIKYSSSFTLCVFMHRSPSLTMHIFSCMFSWWTELANIWYYGHDTDSMFAHSCLKLKKTYGLFLSFLNLPQMSIPLTPNLFSNICYHHPLYHVVRSTLEEHPSNPAASFHCCSSHWGHHASHFLQH